MTTDLPARMLRLLSLLQTRREWSGHELAERLGVTGRTVRRDIERLRELGYPVEGTTGHAGGYRLASGTAMPPLLLDDDEASAVAVALRTAVGGLVGIEETALRALAKLEQVLPSRLRRRVAALEEATSTIAWESSGPRADTATLAVLAAACRDHEVVAFDYTSREATRASRRVEPHGLVASGGLWYLVAYDTDRDDWRIYRLDRLTGPSPTGRRVPPRSLPDSTPDPASYVAAKIAGAPARHRAVATVHASADTVRARTGALAARIRPVDETTCTLDCSNDSLPRVAQVLAALDTDYTLDADPAVADYLGRSAQRVLRAVGGLSGG